MKILWITLLLALLVGCGKQEQIIPEAPESVEELTVPQRTETVESTEETAETTVAEEDTVLDEAAAFAERADYVSAITLLQDAMNENQKPEYKRAYAEYCADYKEQTVLLAEEQAEAGDYLGAVRTINEATALIGPDAELTAMSQSYAQAHVDAERADREAAEVLEMPEEPKTPEVPEEPVVPEVPAEVPQDEPVTVQHEPFYGIWCCATMDAGEAQRFADTLMAQGFDGLVFVTTDWSNLNQNASWYVVTAGAYGTQADAEDMLPVVQTAYPDAYVKYSGTWQG